VASSSAYGYGGHQRLTVGRVIWIQERDSSDVLFLDSLRSGDIHAVTAAGFTNGGHDFRHYLGHHESIKLFRHVRLVKKEARLDRAEPEPDK